MLDLLPDRFKEGKWLKEENGGVVLGVRCFLELSDELFKLGAAKCTKTHQLVIKQKRDWKYKKHLKYYVAPEDMDGEDGANGVGVSEDTSAN